jgi:hypothetical protein
MRHRTSAEVTAARDDSSFEYLQGFGGEAQGGDDLSGAQPLGGRPSTLVARGRDLKDRRRYALEFTDLGRRRLTIASDVSRRLNGEVRQVLGADSVRELRSLLTKLLPTQDG